MDYLRKKLKTMYPKRRSRTVAGARYLVLQTRLSQRKYQTTQFQVTRQHSCPSH